MSVRTMAWTSQATDLRAEWHARWRDASPGFRAKVQVGVFFVVVLGAYHYSLSTLLQSLNVDTPLAYVALVPAIALGLAAVRSRPLVEEPPIHDRQLDFIVGLPLIAAAIAINVLLPRQLSAMFWVWRIDLLSFPLFAAGVLALVFGTRVLWRQRLAVGYLFLAWPLPYSVFALRLLGGFTGLTLAVLRAVLRIVPVADVIRPGDGSLFQVVHHGRAFPMSVVSACSGVNGIVGFLLVGTAFAAVVTGPRARKTLWLIAGMVLLWVINIGRLVFIFWAGKVWGESFAIDVLHPFIGLVTFNLGVVAMLLAMRPLGLHIRRASPNPVRRKAPLAVPRVFAGVAIVAVAGLVMGVSNDGLRSYDLIANAAGEPKLASFTTYPGAPAGWEPHFSTQYTWARPYFGQNSTWLRYSYSPTPANTSGDLYSTLPVTADVVNTTDLASFSAYGVEACYRFHGYRLRDVAQVSLGGGITGQALSYASKSADWTVVYWVWPVKAAGHLHYERVILYLLNTQAGTVRGTQPVAGIKSLHGALSATDRVDARLIQTRSFLVSFARDVVKAQAVIRPGSTLSSAPVVHHGSPVTANKRGEPQPPSTAPPPSIDTSRQGQGP